MSTFIKAGNYVNLKTKNFKIRLHVEPIEDPSKLFSYMTDYAAYRDVKFLINEYGYRQYLKFPFVDRITTKVENGGIGSLRKCGAELNSFFKKEAKLASKITDHTTFINSPAWYMLMPLVVSKKFRDHFGVSMAIDDKMMKKLTRKVFKKSPRSRGYDSLLYCLFSEPGKRFSVCNIEDYCEKCVARYNRSDSHEILSIDDETKASQIAAEWGIPLEHPIKNG